MKLIKPVLQALLLADKIYSDGDSGKKIIAGTFSKLVIINRTVNNVDDGAQTTLKIPAGGMHAGSPFAYISLTDVHGETKITVRYVQLAGTEQQVYFQTEIPIDCKDPLQTIEMVIPLPSLPAIKGVFAIEVLCNSELLGSHRVVVEEMSEESH